MRLSATAITHSCKTTCAWRSAAIVNSVYFRAFWQGVCPSRCSALANEDHFPSSIFSLIKGSIKVSIILAAGNLHNYDLGSAWLWHRDSLVWSICAEKHKAHCNGSMLGEFGKAVETNKSSCGFNIKSLDCSVLCSMWSGICNTCSHGFCAILCCCLRCRID